MTILAKCTRFARQLFWRLGRRMYTASRGDGQNDPHHNGEYWLLSQFLKPSSGTKVLLDVGANRGNWTARALEICGSETVHIHAFEPSMETRSLLSNRFPDNPAVTVQPFALADRVGDATFFTAEVGGGTNSLSSSSGGNTEIVQMTTIDRFLESRSIEAISMVKIDTEGFDLLVLRGAERSLSSGAIELIQFEYNWRWLLNHVCIRDVFDLIRDKPYYFGKLAGNSIEYYDKWHFELDRFFENNYVLIRKDSKLSRLGKTFQFNEDNVAAPTGRTQSNNECL